MSNLTEPKTAASEVCRLHGEIIDAGTRCLNNALRIGAILSEQKEHLGHGNFGPWLKTLPFNERTAQRYMQCHEHRDRLKNDSVSDLNSAYRLLSKTRPVQFRIQNRAAETSDEQRETDETPIQSVGRIITIGAAPIPLSADAPSPVSNNTEPVYEMIREIVRLSYPPFDEHSINNVHAVATKLKAFFELNFR